MGGGGGGIPRVHKDHVFTQLTCSVVPFLVSCAVCDTSRPGPLLEFQDLCIVYYTKEHEIHAIHSDAKLTRCSFSCDSERDSFSEASLSLLS